MKVVYIYLGESFGFDLYEFRREVKHASTSKCESEMKTPKELC